MEEARQVKSALYPLSRDIKNLTTVILNIRNILQAEPEFFTLAAPPGLLVVRRSMQSLLNSTSILMEVNEVALRESAVAETLAQNSMIPVLRPAACLRDAAQNYSGPLSRSHALVTCLNGYLNSLFVYAIASNPSVERYLSAVEATDQHITELKKVAGRLSDQDKIVGLTPPEIHQLRALKCQLQELENEVEDIFQHTALIMGKMNLLSKLSSRLQPVLRIAVAMDGAVRALRHAMAMLKQLSGAFAQVQSSSSPGLSGKDELAQALARAGLPMDAMLQIEFALQTQVERYVLPVLNPLADLTEELKRSVPSNHFLHGLETTLLTQRNRFTLCAERVNLMVANLDNLHQRQDMAVNH